MIYRPEYDMASIGQNLRKLREARHLTVEEVREYLCLGSVQAVYKYERGKSYPQADTLFALMELYEADLFDIIGGPHLVSKKAEAGCLQPASAFLFDTIAMLLTVLDHLLL